MPTSRIRAQYDGLRGAKRLIVINDVGHNVFDDICTINRSHGGVTGAVRALKLPVPQGILDLATDGCYPPDIYPPVAWPLIDQAVTAQLLVDFGQPGAAAGLGQGLDHAFAGVTASVASAASG